MEGHIAFVSASAHDDASVLGCGTKCLVVDGCSVVRTDMASKTDIDYAGTAKTFGVVGNVANAVDDV